MNIREAKQQIKNAMVAYFTKDEFGNYLLPPARQRPVFLLGAPGIGKTAIMEQIAQELEVSMRSIACRKRSRRPCCSFCNTRSSAAMPCPTAGSS